MSTRLNEWASKAQSDRHFVSEGITQQPGSFYNGNFSSSVWGNPPTPPLWRDTPPSSYGACSKEHGQVSGRSAFDQYKTDPVTFSQLQPSEEQGDRVLNWSGGFSAGLQVEPQEVGSSPFTFGFPNPQSASSSSCVSTECMQDSGQFSQSFVAKTSVVNGHSRNLAESSTTFDKKSHQAFAKERAYSLEELSNSWAAVLQSQAELFGSLDSSFTHSLATGHASATGGQEPIQHGHGNPVADVDMNRTSLHDLQFSHFARSCDAGPDLRKSETAPFAFNKKDDLGNFVFGSSTSGLSAKFETTSSLIKKKDDTCTFGTFVSGTSPASETSANAGFLHEKGFHASASGSKVKSSMAGTRVRKHINVIKRRNIAAPVSTSCQPVPSQCTMNGPFSSTSVFTFTMGASDADSVQCPEPGFKERRNAGSVCDPPLCQNPFFFQRAASSISKDRDSAATLNIKGQNIESQHAQDFSEKSSAWHPFAMREEKHLDSCNFVGVASSEGTLYSNSFDRKHETRETSTTTAFMQEPSMETNRTFQESKLAEFDLNSPCKLSADDPRERTVKGGKFGEEIKRQKENQEPNFSFGSQKGTKPFVFGSSRSTCNTKHTAANMDATNKNDHCSKGTKDNKALEHLIAKLGEMGKSHENLTSRETTFHRGEKVIISDCISSKFHKDQEKKSIGTFSSVDAANVLEESDTLNCSIKELGEKLSKLGKLDDAKKSTRDGTGSLSHFSSGTTNGNAMEHAIRELRAQISKLGPFDDIKKQSKEETAKCSASGAQYRSNSILRAVEELSEEIARLGTDKTEDDSNCKVQQCHTFGQSVEELSERLKSLGRANGKGENCYFGSKLQDHKDVAQEAFVFTAYPATAPKDSDSARFPRFKAFPNHSSIGKAHCNPFINANSKNLFPSDEARASSSFPMANPFTTGQPSSIQDVYSGINFFSFGRPTAGNIGQGGSAFGGFEFQGTKGPLRGTSMQRKSGRVCPNSKSREKAKLAGSRRSARFTSMSHSPSSPMDFSPCADKAAPSLSVSFSGDAGQEFVQTSPESELDEVTSENVEDIRIATANLTVGSGKECYKENHTGSGPSDHSSIETNPFILREKKGTWKRASRKGANFSASTKGLWSQMAYTGSCGIGRGAASSFLHSGLSNGMGSREKSQRHTAWNPSSADLFNEGEKCTLMAANEKTVFPRKLCEQDKEQQAFSIARETAATSTATKSVAAEQTCEKWRLRGNQAYAKGDYEKAEDCYTRGAGSVLPGEMSKSCIRASMLCYSNRAATRMAVGRMREALADCNQAMLLDSTFLRVRLRAASCHLALGDSKAAAALFTECWSLAKAKNSDFKIVDDAIDGVRKSQSFNNLLGRASELLQIGTCMDASAALQFIEEALQISPFSEATQGLKAQALFLLRRFEDVLQFCDKTLPSAKENHDAHHHDESLGEHTVFLDLWRWRMCGKSLYQLGKLEESLSLLTKYEEATSGLPSDEGTIIESMATTVILIRNLLRHKAAGNEAFQAGRHVEALELYTAALSCNCESRPYNAVCFCNRAAASQALGNIADAIADCSRAIVLDTCYAKAISRRATLHEMIRDFGQSCNDLQRLITLLEGQEAASKSLKMTRAPSKNAQDLRQARERLERATREMKRDTVVDHYLILGLDVSCSPSEIKKAYRKAALKHHPDKAGQFLVRGENGDDGGLWKEVGDEVRKDAERLFKLIGEAYGILSEPTKRAQYDLEHQMSKGRNSTYQGYSNTEDHEKAGHRYHEDKDGWSGHSHRYQRWQNGPDAAQRDTYYERSTGDSSRTRGRRQRGRKSDYYSWDEY